MKVVDYPIMPVVPDADIVFTDVAVLDDRGLVDVQAGIADAQRIAVDTETHDGIVLRNGLWGAVRTIQIAVRRSDHQLISWVLDVRHLTVQAVAETLQMIPLAYAWNANFDQEVLERYGAPIGQWRDVMLDDSVLWAGAPGRAFYSSLEAATLRYLGRDLTGKGGTQTSFDANSDLTDEQLQYAAADPVMTLCVSEQIDAMMVDAQLVRAANIVQAARPFAVMLMHNGYPFDMESWSAYLETQSVAAAAARTKMVELTGGHDGTLGWNPASSDDVRDQLNTHASGYVTQLLNRPKMTANDPTDKATLTQLRTLGCELAGAILDYRSVAKIAEAFGEKSLSKSFWEGRIHPTYRQALTSTGRWASANPNGQNQPGATKPFIRPADPVRRRIVQADYSGAELRVLGTEAGETEWMNVFISGGDLHAQNAKNMFGVDYDTLKETDPEAADQGRQKAKVTGFGMPYNMGAGLLATTLSNAGVETSYAEAKTIISAYYDANPAVAAYLKNRDRFVETFAKNPGPVDWNTSFRLLNAFLVMDAPRRAFRRKHRRLPTPEELVELVIPPVEQLSLFDPVGEAAERERAERKAAMLEDAKWAFRYDAPVVLRPGGEPLAFESRTLTGRRRLFMVPMASGFNRSENEAGKGVVVSDRFAGVVTAAMLVAATTNKAGPAAIRDEWARQHNINLPSGIDRCVRKPGESAAQHRERARKAAIVERTQCVKAFEGAKRPLMVDFVNYVCTHMGADATTFLLEKALADQIRGFIGAVRNHPIQGTVADIVESAFAELITLCDEFPDLVWIQTVHDSIIGECDTENAETIAVRQKRIMEQVMADIVPGIPAKADTSVGYSADEKDAYFVVPDEVTAVAA